MDTYARTGGVAEREILALIEKHSIRLLIVGLPLSDDGKKNEQCLRVENFCRRLKKRVEVAIEYVDEYASTYEAHEKLGLSGSSVQAARKSGRIDAASAALILQAYLDSHRS